MRDEILRILLDEMGCGYEGQLLGAGDAIDQILKEITKEIERVGNPYQREDMVCQWEGAEMLRKKILFMFKET